MTIRERELLELYLRGGWSIRRIAKHLGRDHSVLSREVRRNRKPGTSRYSAAYAQRCADHRARKTNRRKLDVDPVLKRFVRDRLADDWNPKVIAGVLRFQPPSHLEGRRISHEAIYRYIYDGEGRYEGWWHLLARGKPRRQKRHARKWRQSRIPERISIHARPEVVATRERVGDWESDTMQFQKQRDCLSVQNERKTRVIRMWKMHAKSAEETSRALAGSVLSLPADVWKTITFDNGLEGSGHAFLRRAYGIGTFFCDPYASWQKGGVENANRMIRRYLPRTINLATVTPADIHAIQERINNIPRASLGFISPNDAMRKYLEGGALNG